MAATNPVLQSVSSNRRRRVRHRIQTPAYASFTAESKSAMLDLHEIVNLSEDGVAIQCSTPLRTDRPVDLCLDLAECDDHIYTSARVVWTDASGRAGLLFSELPPASLFRLREWLFLNAMTGAATAGESALAASSVSLHVPTRPSYSDTLAAVTAVQRQVEALGADLPAVLQLIADRALNLLRASGAAIALADSQPEVMECRASSGASAPPVGTRLRLGSGFSGECVKTGSLLRCDDTDIDRRVDRESCRVLGVRSILAAPVRAGEKTIGILEVFAPGLNAFTENDGRVLQRLADAVIGAVDSTAAAENLPPLNTASADHGFASPMGGVLFASVAEKPAKAADSEERNSGGISLPRSYLILLACAAATIALVLGIVSAPWIQNDVIPWIQIRLHAEHGQLQTVLASSRAPKPPAVETASFDQLKQMAENGDAAAENALGLRYAEGDGAKLDEPEAARWFLRSAEHGNVLAQSRLGSWYLVGRGVRQDYSQAYFWMALARATGDETSRVLAPNARAHLTRDQVTSIELDANRWLQQHQPATKPPAGR